MTFDAARRSKAEVVSLAKVDERQVILRQHYLKLVSGRKGSEAVVGEKFSFAPREENGGISVAALSEKKFAALLREPRIKEEFTATNATLIGHPANQISGGQFLPDLPLLGMTPSLLADGKIRVAFFHDGGAAYLTQPFELDFERDRWYAILIDVQRSPDGASREHLCCLRVELPHS